MWFQSHRPVTDELGQGGETQDLKPCGWCRRCGIWDKIPTDPACVQSGNKAVLSFLLLPD